MKSIIETLALLRNSFARAPSSERAQRGKVPYFLSNPSPFPNPNRVHEAIPNPNPSRKFRETRGNQYKLWGFIT